MKKSMSPFLMSLALVMLPCQGGSQDAINCGQDEALSGSFSSPSYLPSGERTQPGELFRYRDGHKMKGMKPTPHLFKESRRLNGFPRVSSLLHIQREFSRSAGSGSILGTEYPASRSDIIEILINGSVADTIIQGEDFVVTVAFSTGSSVADLSFWMDVDGNGILNESVDFDIKEDEHIEDNESGDEDETAGVYQFTLYGDEEGPNRIGNLGLLVQASDDGGSDTTFVYIVPMTGDYSVSGSVTPAKANILVGAFPENREKQPWMTLTDEMGLYQLFLPEEGFYSLFSEDFMGVTGGLLTDTVYFDILVDCHLVGFDFSYVPATAWVDGKITDEKSNPLGKVRVQAHQEGDPESLAGTETDENGEYQLGVESGNWWIHPLDDDLIPDYLAPHDTLLSISEGATATADFIAYSTDSSISGAVYLDDSPVAKIWVSAGSTLGRAQAESGTDGSYQLSVASGADANGGYSLWINDWDVAPDVYVEETYDSVSSGSQDMVFHLHTVSGAIEGYVYDTGTGRPLDNAQVWARNDSAGWERQVGTRRDGFFHMAVPNGSYEVKAGAKNYEDQVVATVDIKDRVVSLNIYLQISLSMQQLLHLPTQFKLAQNFPNPFNPTTTIRYDLPELTTVRLTIYDLLGREIRVLRNGILPSAAGAYQVIWDGTDDHGRPLGAGLYFYRIETARYRETRKMILLK